VDGTILCRYILNALGRFLGGIFWSALSCMHVWCMVYILHYSTTGSMIVVLGCSVALYYCIALELCTVLYCMSWCHRFCSPIPFRKFLGCWIEWSAAGTGTRPLTLTGYSSLVLARPIKKHYRARWRQRQVVLSVLRLLMTMARVHIMMRDQ
jgi:hypothetical protein